MKPVFEKIAPNPGSSFATFLYNLNETGSFPFWHIHPEFEIVYIKQGCGSRHIGNHYSTYNNGDLIVLGPGIPHSNFGNTDFPKSNFEIIVQINAYLLKNNVFQLHEFQIIQKLFTNANHAISFYGNTKLKVAKLLNRLVKAEPFNKIILLMQILFELAKSNEYTLLNASSLALETHSNDYNRLSKIFAWVGKNYNNKIELEDIANYVGLTRNSFCRFFKNLTGKTFTQYLNEYRINKVCELMISENRNIKNIILECGFNEPTYFHRLFKKLKKFTPAEYKNKLMLERR